jgi:hypothetical protein
MTKTIILDDTAPLLSFIIGMGIAILLFHKDFQFKSVLPIPINELDGRVTKFEDKCYIYHARDTNCKLYTSK